MGFGKVATEETGPNNVSGIVWAIKVGGTRNRLPYVIILYKRQERQNMAFEKSKKFWPPI